MINFIESRYCRVTRYLALSIGIWPYKKAVRTKIQVSLIMGIIILAVIFQVHIGSFEVTYICYNSGIVSIMGLCGTRQKSLAKPFCYLAHNSLVYRLRTPFTAFLTHEFSYHLFLKILASIVPEIVYILKILTFVLNTDEVRTVFELVQYDWDTLTDNVERAIIEKYANQGRIGTIIFTMIVFPAVFLFILNSFVPEILDIIAPLNESRPHQLPHIVEYFFDQDKYFYLILLHILICDLIGVAAVTATESASFIIVQHICGLFEIVSFRFERVVEDSILNALQADKSFSCHRRIKSVAQIHQRALECADFINDSFAPHYFLLLGISVVSLSANLLILTQSLMLRDFSDDFLIALILVVVHFFYMFCCNYIGQKILDHSQDVFFKTYSTRWYMTPLPVQKSLLFFMRRSIKPCGFITGGVFTPSYMGFSSLVSSSMSYFTVLYSINH